MPLNLGSMLTAGLGGGLTQLGDYQQAEKQRKMVAAHQAAQIALQQASQVLESQKLGEDTRHNQAQETNEADKLAFLKQKDVGDTEEKMQAMFDSGMARSGIGFVNPIAAYKHFNPPAPQVPSAMDSALQPFQEHQQAAGIKALMDAAGPAFEHAAKGNVARVPIPGSENYGGAFAINNQYNPSSFYSAQTRVGSGDARSQANAVNKAIQNIQAAGNAEFAARRSTIGDITKYNQRQLDSINVDTKNAADLRRRAVASSELAGLQAAWPDLGLTVEDLLGEAAQGGAPGGARPGGAAAPGGNPLLPHGSTNSSVRMRTPGKNPLLP